MAVFKSALLVVVPIVLFVGGAELMSWLSGRHAPAGLRCRGVESATPLNQRLCGYDAEAVAAYWKTLRPSGHQAERLFLKLDLVFPVLYGGAFLASLLVARSLLGRPFSAAWIVVPIAVTVFADWIENLVQLYQLQRWMLAGKAASASDLNATWIGVASFATIVKLWVFIGCFAFLLGLAAWAGFRPGESS